jgi:hypothetical protein
MVFQWQKRLTKPQVAGLLVLCAVLAVVSNKLDDLIAEQKLKSSHTTKDGWKLE